MPSSLSRLGGALLVAASLVAASCGRGEGAPASTATAPAPAAFADPTTSLEARTVPAGLAEGVRLGRADAPMVIEMYADFGCPHCLEFTVSIEPRLVAGYVETGKAALVYRFFPLRDLTAGPAIAAFCAGEQNRFWEYHHLLFAAQARAANGGPPLAEAFGLGGLQGLADRAGIDRAAWDNCIASDRAVDAIVADVQRGTRLGVVGTPTFVINGQVLQNPGSWAAWEAILGK